MLCPSDDIFIFASLLVCAVNSGVIFIFGFIPYNLRLAILALIIFIAIVLGGIDAINSFRK